MIKYKDKRLLILNGLALACDIVSKAREKGLYTIVADKAENAPTKLVAHDSHAIAPTDVKSIIQLAKERQIDGIITGFVDANLPAACSISEALGLPFYAAKEHLEITMDKSKFKALCQDYGIPTVPGFAVKDCFDERLTSIVQYPVLVKPVDNTGSRGIVICKDEKELVEGVENALLYSTSKTVLVEKFMDLSTPGVNLDYVISDGEVFLSSVGDLYAHQNHPSLPPLTSAVFFPSVRTEEYIAKIDAKVKRMFKGMGLKNGVLFIQSFYENGTFYFYEMGYRLGGGQSYQVISHINGVDHLDMLIDFAVSGVMCTDEIKSRISPRFRKKGFILILLIKPGKIKKIIGLESLAKLSGVINVMQAYREGDCVPISAENTTQQNFGRIHFVTDTLEELTKAVNLVKENLQIIDENGESMLIDNFDTNDLLAYEPSYWPKDMDEPKQNPMPEPNAIPLQDVPTDFLD